MKAYLIFLFTTISLTSGSIPIQSKIPRGFLIESTFYPSFHFPVKVRICKSDNFGYVIFTTLDKKIKDKIVSADSIQLTMTDFNKFFKSLNKKSLLDFSYDSTTTGNDGIRIATRIEQDGQTNSFRIWSPVRDKLFDAIFHLLNEKLPKQEKYVEDIQAYFNYGLPVKIKSNKPFIARFYGGISIDMGTDLQRFFRKVPKQKKAIIDITNLFAIGTVFDEDFEEFDLSHPNLIWVIHNNQREYFKQFGLDTMKMAETLDLAKSKLQL